MGEVYRARDTALGRDVAIKILHPNFLHDTDRLRRFRQEAQSTALLNHSNILGIHFIGEHDGVPFLVCELLEGESLRERLRREPLQVRKALDYASQIIEGLAAAHDKGIIHRDLKPENIFLTKDGHAKILDFGLAKLIANNNAGNEANSPTLSQGSAPGVILGTVGYMSPEQIRGQSLDVRSDIFSFGVVLYEMLTGKNAFLRSTAVDTMSALLKDDPPEITESFPAISQGLDRVVHRALEKDPADRFQSVRDLGFALQAVSGSSAASRVTVSPEPAKRRRRFATLGLLGVSALIAVLGGYFLGAHRSNSVAATHPEFQQLTFRRGAIRSARFAPDGKTVIYSANMDGFPVRLYVTRSDGPESQPIEHDNIGLFAVSSLGELAVALGCMNPGYARCFGTLARMPFSGGAPREVASGVHAADWDPAGKQIAIVRREGGRFLVEFPIGKVIYATPGWVSDLRVSPDGRYVAIADHPALGNDAGNLMVLDRNGKPGVTAGPWNSLEGIAWAPSGKEVWFAASSGREAFADQVRSVDLAGQQRMLLRMPGITRLHDVARDGRILLSKEQWRSMMPYRGGRSGKEHDLSWLDLSALCDLTIDAQSVIFAEAGQASYQDYYLYQRSTDGSPAVKLGNGFVGAISPDKKWVLAVGAENPSRLELLPTGTGEVKTLPSAGLTQFGAPSWAADGKLVAFEATDGRSWRFYLQDLDGGLPRSFSSEVASPDFAETQLVSPDGKLVIARDLERKGILFPLEGSKLTNVPGLQPDELIANWSADSRHIYVFRPDVYPVRLIKLDVFTGSRSLQAEIMPEDPIGLDSIYSVRISRDEKIIAYSYTRSLSELYPVTGLE